MPVNSSVVAEIDLTKSPEEIVTDLINFDNGTKLPVSSLQFGTPRVLVGNKYNTALLVTAVGPKYSGSKTVSYNRKDLATIPKALSTVFELGSATKISDLIPTINELYSVKLTTADYVDADLPEMVNLGTREERDFDLVAKATSLIYIEKVELSIFREPVIGIDITTLFSQTVLTGLTYVQPTA